MNRLLPLLFLLLALPALAQRRVGLPDDGRTYFRGKLSAPVLDSLRAVLTRIYGAAPADTICLHYYYDLRDGDNRPGINASSDEEVRRIANREVDYLEENKWQHPGTSYHYLRQPGTRSRRLLSFNRWMHTDEGEAVRRLLPFKRGGCGPAIIILPSGEYVLMPADCHFYVAYMPAEKLAALWAQ